MKAFCIAGLLGAAVCKPHRLQNTAWKPVCFWCSDLVCGLRVVQSLIVFQISTFDCSRLLLNYSLNTSFVLFPSHRLFTLLGSVEFWAVCDFVDVLGIVGPKSSAPNKEFTLVALLACSLSLALLARFLYVPVRHVQTIALLTTPSKAKRRGRPGILDLSSKDANTGKDMRRNAPEKKELRSSTHMTLRKSLGAGSCICRCGGGRSKLPS